MRIQGLGSNEIEQSYWLVAIKWTHELWMKVEDQKLTNQNYMAPFWKENQLVQTKKKEKRRVHDLKNQDAN